MRAIAVAAILWCAGAAGADVEVGFSPGGGAATKVLETIRAARSEIVLAGYEFTSPAVASALIAAKERGVAVYVVLDAGENVGKSYSKMYALLHAGIEVRVDSQVPLMHDKFLVVDQRSTETGSFNFTANAERRNAENVIVIRDPATALAFRQEFSRLWDESVSPER